MKVMLRGYGVRVNAEDRYIARAQAADLVRTRGTGMVPQPPRDIICQPSTHALMVTWNYPPINKDIQRWRVYRDDENTLYAEIKDRGTRQCLVSVTSGSPPPVSNVFISSMNAAGVESAKVQAQGTPLSSTATSPVPAPPPEYNSVNSGGKDLTTDYIRVGNR